MKKHTRKIIILFITIILTITLCGCKKCGNNSNINKDDNKEFDYTDLSVRDYVGENGIVTAASPYAAKIGLDILKNGGNAFDAAVAVAFAIGVVEMDACGIGGGGLMIAYNVNTKKSLYYNFREFASSSVSTDLENYKNQGSRYALYTAVPTELAGLNCILKDQGSISLKDAIAPSIALAKEGIIASQKLIANINDNSHKVNRNEYLKPIFKKESGGRLKVGDKIIQNDLADTLQKISDNGIEYFYKGEFAQKLVDTITSSGGYITKEDLELAYNKNYLMDDSIIKGTYKDYELMTVGSPSSGGIMLIEMLNMLENYSGSIKDLGHNSCEYINLISTVMQLAYGDKEKYLADKNFVEIPLDGILNKDYAKERFMKYSVGKAYLGTATSPTEKPYGNPYKYSTLNNQNEYTNGSTDSHYSTTSFSVVDKLGNMVTITQTINNFFGCGVSPEGSGFFLNDQMKDFSFNEGSINMVEPLKQPSSYMLPTVVLKNGKPYATFGTPGGSRIPSAGLQVFLNMVEFDMNIQDAINAFRVYCFTTNESDRTKKSKTLYIENGLSNLKDKLTSYGYNVMPYGEDSRNSYFGGIQGIKVENDKYHGGADPRRDGKTLGF